MARQSTTSGDSVLEAQPRAYGVARALLWAAFAAGSVALTVLVAERIGRPRRPELQVPPAVGLASGPGGLRIERVRELVRRLTEAPSRMSGSPGADRAFELICRELDGLGLRDREVQELDVAVPVVREGVLEADSPSGRISVPLHPLWPNLARTSRTPPAGIRGSVVDVGRGTDAELAGKPITGSIVVMDWDSDQEWLNAAELGAKAIVFRANERATGSAARLKFLTVPADIPRFYVARGEVPALDRLLASGAGPAAIRCDMDWERAKARNVLARVWGEDAPGRSGDPDLAPIVFHAYYDSVSVVPELAPGAEQACGAAALLELARLLAGLRERPSRGVYVLFTGGHGQALAGMTRFVRSLKEHLARGTAAADGAPLSERMGAPGLFVGLDLSTHSGRMGLFCQGHFRGEYEHLLRPRFSVLGLKLAEYVAGAGDDCPFVDCINLTGGRGWWTYFPFRVPFESEIPALAGLPAVTLATIDDDRRRVDTPDDTFEALRFDLLARQISPPPAGEGRPAGGLADVALALAFWKGPFTSSPLDDCMGRISGRVVWLDQERDFTPSEPLAGATVFLKAKRNDMRLVGTRGVPCAMTDAEGRFEFDALTETPANWEFGNCLLEAYGTATPSFLRANGPALRELSKALGGLAPRGEARAGSQSEASVPPGLEPDGSIIYAVDMARPGEYPWTAAVQGKEQSRNLVCFPCRSITLFGLTDPRGYLTLTDVQVLNAATQSPPFQYGQSMADSFFWNADENCCTVWADPSIRVRLTLGLGFQEKRLVLLNNSPEDPVGRGFALTELATIPSMILQGALDMRRLDESRSRKLLFHGVNSPRVRSLREQAGSHLDRAAAALESRDYSTYRAESEKGWALESKAYSELLSTTNDMIQGVLFYLALLLPFSYCLERLVFASSTIRRRIAWMTIIFAASFGALALIHPAFRFTMTPLLVLLAFVILALAGVVSVLVAARFDAMLREAKQLVTGTHEEAVSAGSIAVRALDLGIANIRRRPQRGFLTALTIVLVTFTLLSFTSVVPTVSISRLPHRTGRAAYAGLLARDRRWSPLNEALYRSLERTFERPARGAEAAGVVAGRGWFFSDASGRISQIDLTSEHPGKRFTAVSLLCMEGAESAVTGADKTLVAGRWFRGEDDECVILGSRAAACLGYGAADIGRSVFVFGRGLPLAGIYDEAAFDALRDLDGEPLTPVDFVRQEQMAAERMSGRERADTLEEYEHHPSAQIALVPLRLGRRWGASLRSVAVRTASGLDPMKEAEAHARRSNQTILASDGRAVTLFAALDTSDVSLAAQVAVPVLLGFVMVLGTMLGSVYERKREIFVYNSVGLSPGSVAALFLAESSVYAILGASSGYLLGQIVSKVLLETGALSGLSLNYSAGTTVLVACMSMLIVLISTLYPARQAFFAAIPESKRSGPARAEPAPGAPAAADAAAETVSLFLPFVATPSSVLGMQAYMHEYLDGLQGLSVGSLAVDDLRAFIETGEEGKAVPVLAFKAWLAPFDLGISHDVRLRIVYRADRGVHQYHLTATRSTGDQQNWRRLTPRFVQTLRKQLLMWRILPAEAQESYVRRGEALFAGGPDSGAARSSG